MAVYLVNSFDIFNFEGFQKYLREVKILLDKHGAQILASDLKAIALEGDAKTMNAVIRFPSKEAALNCYNDPAYQEIKPIRLNTTSSCSMILVEEFK